MDHREVGRHDPLHAGILDPHRGPLPFGKLGEVDLPDRRSRPSRRRYVLMTVVGIATFLYPFWPSESAPDAAHRLDAPILAAVVAALVVGAITLEVRRGTMNGATISLYGWVWGFLFGAVMNLWFWPFIVDGGPLSWSPDYGLAQTLAHYWRFYAVTSFAWGAARAFINALLILVLGRPLLRSMRRFVGRTEPVAVFE